MADQLATVADLASALQIDIGSINNATATLLIECATAVVQAEAGQRIVQVSNDVMVLDLDEYDGGPYLILPERPVTTVGPVLIGSTAITDFTPMLSRSKLWRALGWRSTLLNYYDQPSTVTVTNTHGYASSNQKIQLARQATLSLAVGVYSNPSGAIRESIDDYSVAFEAMSAQMAASPFLSAALKKQYGKPIGSIRLVASR